MHHVQRTQYWVLHVVTRASARRSVSVYPFLRGIGFLRTDFVWLSTGVQCTKKKGLDDLMSEHWSSGSGGGGGNVVQWLSQKAAKPAQEDKGRGALEWLSAQTKTGAVKAESTSPPPQAQVHAPASLPAKGSWTEIVAPRSKQEAVKSAVVAPASGGVSIPVPRSRNSNAPPQPESTTTPPPGPVAGSFEPYPRSRQVNARPERKNQDAARRERQKQREDSERAQYEQQQAAIAAQEAQMQSDPAYREWVEEQQKLAAQGDAVRMRVFQHLQNQDSLAAVEQQQNQRTRDRLDVGEVLKLIAEHDVTIVCTDTGSGKSTMIPGTLLETGNSNTRIVATQPRRTATIALANHVASLRRERVGDDIGYWIRGDKKGNDESTRLWYMTSYTLLLHLLKDPLHPPFTHIILDEFHERQADLEVTTAILKLCLKHKTSNFKLILMSATLNSEDWENYFEGLTVAIYKQSEPEHPIHDFFLADVCALTGTQYNRPQGFSPVLVDHMVMENSLFIAQQLIAFLNAVAQPHQSILVFLPGRAQVEQFVTWAHNTLRNRIDPIAWHSAVDVSVIQQAINRRGQRAQKVYLATDIAEVSITLPDVVFVIDLGLVKRPLITGSQPATVLYPPLMTQWVSKVNIAQRRGRVGRVQQGFYFCLLTADTIPKLLDFPASPIQHSRIDELALHSLQVVANPIALFGLCRGQPQIETISTTMRTLTSLGAILLASDSAAKDEDIHEVHSNAEWSKFIMQDASSLVGAEIDSYVCTFIGRLMQLIPVSTQQGMLVFYGFLTGLESLMILAAAVTNSMSPFDVRVAGQNKGKGGGNRRGHGFESMARAMEETENTMKEYSLNLSSDVVCVMGAVLRCMVQCRGHENDPEFMRTWCADRNMSYDKSIAIIELNQHIKYELSGFVPFRDIEDASILLTQLEKVAPIVVACCCGAFASQALEVTTEGSMQHSSKETALGLFTDLKGMPDLHSPSCIRWEVGDIIVPVSVSLRFSHMLVGFATAVKTSKEFYLALLLFAYRLQYAAFADDKGSYYEFAVHYSNTTRYIETDGETGAMVLEYRQLCNNLCKTMRLQYSNKDLTEDEFNAKVLSPMGLAPLDQQQRVIASTLVSTFFGPPHAKMDVAEVQHGGDELDHQTLFSFALGTA